MTACVALFRGVNVGGHGRLPMRDLVALLEDLGLADVSTYVQSGNAVFRCPARTLAGAGARKLGTRIRAAVADRHGFAPDVLLLRLQALEAIVDGNPFPEAEAAPTTLHVSFLSEPADAPDVEGLERVRAADERFLLTDAALYLHAPGGIARSKLAARAERLVGVPMTSRNWRSVIRILALARALPPD